MIAITNPDPNYWQREIGPLEKYATSWSHKLTNLRVLRSRSKTRDGREWIHVSVSRSDMVPSYYELCKVKREFIGEEKEAYQVFAAKKDHVNIHQYCLHLWASLNDEKCVANLHDLIDEIAL